ncbi:WD repeat protein Rrb1 [Schizosaccharomyces japonicus yFS275]|uniref:WD repeat protein Rrb1 n=1 Tax=Schizosaccharomyces japonicus (strain yFS275 / FY16936) TaxID=402676 RepID=B6JZT3_SCHJY|nr:WD repeat protein Rrb1 [Schizosaccharomyces japonicus yFS275]EEB06083.1 WD repeat protein Rrb1 [Schizosaccharomyces japonicus yFS275]
MSKRAVEEDYETSRKNGPSANHSSEDAVDADMGEFEDAWDDEVESEEEEYMEADGADEEEHGQEDIIPEEQQEVWLPGGEIKENENLVVDQSAYEMLHNIQVRWPFLSIDVIPDEFGEERRSWPHRMYLVGGSQAEKTKDNEITVMKLSQLYKTQHDDDDSDASDDSDIEEDPLLEFRSLPVEGSCNRVCAAKPSTNESLIASFHETGKVHIWNVAPQLRSMEQVGMLIPPGANDPVYTVNNHSTEGYALDWSPFESMLLSGDNKGEIYLTKRDASGHWVTDNKPFQGHASSVEDIQWSPTERTVFASCSSDGTFRIWDIRNKNHTPALTVNAHPGVDINVLSWNTKVPYLLATGADDGMWCVWDLRQLKQSTSAATPVASFKWHKAPITSIEWHPNEESVIAVAGADDQVSMWDLSVELDVEEQQVRTSEGMGALPPQLMFVHMGQQHIKELHWHRQIPGVVISTAQSGINVYKSISF